MTQCNYSFYTYLSFGPIMKREQKMIISLELSRGGNLKLYHCFRFCLFMVEVDVPEVLPSAMRSELILFCQLLSVVIVLVKLLISFLGP